MGKFLSQRQGNTSLQFNGTQGKSRTEQHHANGTSVDAILRQYATKGVDQSKVGLFRWAHIPAPEYGIQPDCDYQTHLNNVIKVQEYFAKLPAQTRDMFHNDPAIMLGFIADPKNRKRAENLGLLPKPPEKKAETPPQPAQPATPPTAPPAPNTTGKT